VHNSPFVIAGVYFLIRFSPSFGYLLKVILSEKENPFRKKNYHIKFKYFIALHPTTTLATDARGGAYKPYTYHWCTVSVYLPKLE